VVRIHEQAQNNLSQLKKRVEYKYTKSSIEILQNSIEIHQNSIEILQNSIEIHQNSIEIQ
jgi:predicted metal-dependent hydrolase